MKRRAIGPSLEDGVSLAEIVRLHLDTRSRFRICKVRAFREGGALCRYSYKERLLDSF